MSHKIITFAPLHNNGATSFGILLAQALTYSNMRALYTFTQAGQPAPEFTSVTGLSDPSRSVTQLVKLIGMQALKSTDILDFTCQFAKNAFMIDISDKLLSDREQRQIIRHVFGSVPTDIVICDDSSTSQNDTSRALLDIANQVFIVISPSDKNYKQLHEWLRQPQFANRKDIYIVVNYYDEVIDSVRNIAHKIGIPVSHVCKLHYNPYLRKCTQDGDIQYAIPAMYAKDPRFINLTGDFRELVSCVRSEMSTAKRR